MQKAWAPKQAKSKIYGFTIVELLIVVVVIAILAAITIVAYNGIQNRAKESSIQTSISQGSKKLASHYALNNDTYPDSANFASVTGLTNSSDVSYDYFVGADQKSYCASAASSNVSIPSYASTNTSSGITKGRCVFNIEPNPSSEVQPLNGAGAGSATRVMSTTQKYSGSSSTRFTWASGSAGLQTTTVTVSPSTTYSLSLYIYGESGALPSFSVGASDYATNVVPMNGSTATGSWQRLSRTYTTTSTQTTMRAWSTVSSASVYYADAVLMTPLSNGTASYPSGTLNNWTWTGATDSSTSFGPAVIQ